MPCPAAGLARADRLDRALAVMVATLLAAACSVPTSPDGYSAPAPPAGSPPAMVPSDVMSEMFTLTNTERTRGGLTVLHANAQLNQAAQIHADQMVAAGRIDHVLPDARYPTMQDRLAAAGYRWRAAGENVASGHRNATHVLDAWMETAGHRANILNDTFTEIGVGYAVDGTGRPYYVQVFGRPME